MTKPRVKIKNALRAVKYKNLDGVTEMFINLGGRWCYVGGESYGNFTLFTHKLEHQSLRELVEDGDFVFADSALERWSGKSIKQLLSKSFIFEWETNQYVYGVPF